jgi:hydroxymethylbilane synthase
MMRLRIGTRGSTLALAQAGWVKQKIEENGAAADLVIIKTSGDRFVDVAIQSVGGKGLFTKEIEEALLSHDIDLAVHSMKDLPTEVPDGLAIAAVPPREDPRDVLVSRNNVALRNLPKGASIATGSLRRKAQLLYYRSDLSIVPIRGNVDTRLHKLEAEGLDAIVLAAAGLKRIGRHGRISEYLSSDVCLSAVAQGALGIETRADEGSRQAVGFLHHTPSFIEVLAERAFLRRLGGGCHVPVAARAIVDGDQLDLTGVVADTEGRRLFRGTLGGSTAGAADLGTELAERLLEQGAGTVLADG